MTVDFSKVCGIIDMVKCMQMICAMFAGIGNAGNGIGRLVDSKTEDSEGGRGLRLADLRKWF